MLKWAVGQRRSESSCCGPPPKRTRRCSSGKENSSDWEAGSRESLFTRLEPSALRDVSNYHRLGETPPRTPDPPPKRRLSLKRRKSEERVLEWVDSPERKRRLSHDPVRSLLQIEFSPLLPLYPPELSPSPVELDHKEIPLREEEKETILSTPRVREEIRRLRTSTVSPLARRLNYLKLGGKILESPAPWIQPPSDPKDDLCDRLRTPPSGNLEDSLAFLDSVREPEPPSTLRRMRSIRRPRRKHPISSLTLPGGVPSPFESPAVLARLRHPSFLSRPEDLARLRQPEDLTRLRPPSLLTLPEELASPFESPAVLARLRQPSVLSLPEDEPSPTVLARLRQPSILTLPEDLASPFESPAVLGRLRQTSILTLPEGIPSPASPCLQPLSDTSTTSSNKISDEDDAVSNIGSAEQSPCPVVEEKSRSRRCLTFASPVSKRPRRTLSLRQQGELELSINYDSPALTIHVIKGKSLQPLSGSGTCNAYIKVSLVPAGEERAFHRTCVRKDSANPRFDTKFVLALAEEDISKRVLVSAWHRDRRNRKSEFLGCMSFAVKHAIKRDISGSFRLLSQSCGRIKNVPTMTNSENIWHQHTDVMANQSESSVEELLSVDESDIGPPNDTPGVRDRRKLKSFKKDTERVHEDQIFLRHLELDPPEEEGNKSGRTPFTSTRTLARQPGTSFGFSIAWTHPPRVERVEAGLPADQAGLRPGDYVIFVGKTNVVTLQEDEILQLIKSYGDRVVFEVYRKVSGNGIRASTGLLTQPRPSTACSGATTATSIDRRKLHLPQVTFTTEQGHGSEEETRKKSVYQLLGREQQYALCMQFGIARFLVPLAERKDIISQADHAVLFQNIQELLRHTEDILELYVLDETLGLSLGRIYYKKMNALNNSYRRYCIGLKKADCILVEKTRNPNFMKLITEPPIPKRRPDLTTFIHKPLEHFREVLKLLQTALNSTKVKDDDSLALAKVIQEMQATYRDITVESGLMEPEGEGRPLLSLQDLESRLVFTRCKPFVLSSPGRQWIFGGDLSRVEGRSVRPFWALLFSDLLLFAKVSRDRVIFVTEDPLPLNTISQALFSIRKKATEFRLLISSGPAGAESPAVGGCADLRGTPRKGPRRRTLALRAPTPELKAVWQNLIQRQIIYVNTARGGTPASSPMDSPDPLTAESLESVSIKRQEPKPVTVTELIEHRCRQLGKTGMSKGSALHLSLWMRGQLGEEGSPEALSEPEPWSPGTMRRRAREIGTARHSLSRCQPIDLSDHSSDDSQKTVRSFSGNSEKVMAVCRKCHKTCLLNNNNSLKKSDTRRIDINANCPKSEGFSDDWGESSNSALSPTDPFLPVPHISVQPATPLNNNFSWGTVEQNNSSFDCDKDGAESDGEVPYRSLSPTGLKRYGTVSSLEKLEGEDSDQEAEEIPQDYPVQYETVGQSIRGWTVRAGTYVVEKMAFLERIGEDSRGVSFIERYLRTNPDSKHSEELIATSTSLAGEEECETSGATSGEEIWGTPTSGDSGVTSPNNEDSMQHYEATLLGTAFDDAREQLMMDKLLSGVSVMGSLVPLCPVSRGFPQRRRLDPLPEDEEESSDSSSSEEATKSYSTDQGNKSDSCAAKAKSATSTPHRFFNRLKLRRSHSADSKTARQSKIMELLRGSKSEEHTSSSRGSRLSRLFSRDSQDDIPTTLPPDVIQKREHDKNFEKRFWKQLRKRRLSGGSSPKPPFSST